MAKGKLLSDVEKGQIKVLKENGLSNRKIARQIKRSEKVVRNFLRLGEKYGQSSSKNKRNCKVSRRDISRIKEEATKNRLTASQIVAKLQLPIGKRRVQKILSQSKNIKWKKSMSKPPLTAVHKEARLEFAKHHMAWTEEWRNVIFSDEKKFNLDGPDGLSYYWHDLQQNNPPRMSRNFGGGSLMIWGAFSYHGKLTLCFVPTKMNSERYVEMLEDVLISYLEEKSEINFIFQQDNASIHVSQASKNFFSSRSIPLLDWPARSPDLNPIENVWGIIARTVYRNGRQFSNVSELKLAILQAWLDLDRLLLKNLADSMPKRIFEVISEKGGIIKY